MGQMRIINLTIFITMKLKFKMLSLKTRYLTMTVGISMMLFTSGCFNENDDFQPVELSYVSIYHASPDTEDLDIVIGANNQVNAVPFGYEDFSGYLSLYPGDRYLKFNRASTSTVVLDTTLTLVKNKIYSVFLADSLESIEAVVLIDSAQTPETGKAMVRFVNLSPDAPGVKLFIDGQDLPVERAFKEATAFIKTDAGTVDLEFRTADGANEVLLAVPQIELISQQYYTILLNGFINPPAGNTNAVSSDIIKN